MHVHHHQFAQLVAVNTIRLLPLVQVSNEINGIDNPENCDSLKNLILFILFLIAGCIAGCDVCTSSACTTCSSGFYLTSSTSCTGQ